MVELDIHKTIAALAERFDWDNHGWDYVGAYGEPGYSSTGPVVLGYYWCHCDRVNDGQLHGQEAHHPRIWAALEEAGVSFEWSDEWYADHEAGKAWRTQPDSYSWQPSLVWSGCDYITPDDGIDVWLEWAIEDPAARCIPSRVWSSSDLEAEGFELFEGGFENGWHPGQDADPSKILAEIRERMGDDAEVAFMLDGTGQFDIRFSAYTRTTSEEGEG